MDKRGSGILLHLTSLPSAYGVGDLGPEAYRFVDFLARTRQCCWQVLPLNPTDSLGGDSPYSCTSAFAGNTLLISPDLLLEEGLLSIGDLRQAPSFPEGRCVFPRAARFKRRLLQQAFEAFGRAGRGRAPFEEFCVQHASWMEDFSLFAVIRSQFGPKAWNQWPRELKNRSPESLEDFRKSFRSDIEREKFWQYLFYKQWASLKKRCRDKGVTLFGDLPFYLRLDSADVWANPELFKLDREKRPAVVSGVPPDSFCRKGQRWGNPVYRWSAHRRNGYRWWMERIAHSLELFDTLRIDHFRGLVAHWEIPSGEKTAVRGKWVKARANEFLGTLKKNFPHLPFVAEDLGFITDDVRKAMDRCGIPGMKVLLLAFGEDEAGDSFLPHAHGKDFLVYTGTHDNNTTRGWFEEEASPEDRRRFFSYLGRAVPAKEVHWEMVRLAMMSVARLAILPLQDVLGLGAEARMNRPSTARGNWRWRVCARQISPRAADRLLEATHTYGRG